MKKTHNSEDKIFNTKWYEYSEENGIGQVADTKKELFAYGTERIESGIYHDNESKIWYYRGDQLIESVMS